MDDWNIPLFGTTLTVEVSWTLVVCFAIVLGRTVLALVRLIRAVVGRRSWPGDEVVWLVAGGHGGVRRARRRPRRARRERPLPDDARSTRRRPRHAGRGRGRPRRAPLPSGPVSSEPAGERPACPSGRPRAPPSPPCSPSSSWCPAIVAAIAIVRPQWYPTGDMAQAELHVRGFWSHPPLVGAAGRIQNAAGVQGSHPGPLLWLAMWPIYALGGSTSTALVVSVVDRPRGHRRARPVAGPAARRHHVLPHPRRGAGADRPRRRARAVHRAVEPVDGVAAVPRPDPRRVVGPRRRALGDRARGRRRHLQRAGPHRVRARGRRAADRARRHPGRAGMAAPGHPSRPPRRSRRWSSTLGWLGVGLLTGVRAVDPAADRPAAADARQPLDPQGQLHPPGRAVPRRRQGRRGHGGAAQRARPVAPGTGPRRDRRPGDHRLHRLPRPVGRRGPTAWRRRRVERAPPARRPRRRRRCWRSCRSAGSSASTSSTPFAGCGSSPAP